MTTIDYEVVNYFDSIAFLINANIKAYCFVLLLTE